MGCAGFLVDLLLVLGAQPGPAVEAFAQDVGVPGMPDGLAEDMDKRGMAAPAADGTVLADFDTILAAFVPELAGRVKAVAFDSETGAACTSPPTFRQPGRSCAGARRS